MLEGERMVETIMYVMLGLALLYVVVRLTLRHYFPPDT